MVEQPITLLAGVVVFALGVLGLMVSLLGVDLPALAFAFVAAGLFAGVYLIGITYPDRPI